MLEKYMTFCKNLFIDSVMQWRLRYLACQFTHMENIAIKIRLGMIRTQSKQQMEYSDPVTKQITTDYKKLGP